MLSWLRPKRTIPSDSVAVEAATGWVWEPMAITLNASATAKTRCLNKFYSPWKRLGPLVPKALLQCPLGRGRSSTVTVMTAGWALSQTDFGGLAESSVNAFTPLALGAPSLRDAAT